jgi:transposase InsO family protein
MLSDTVFLSNRQVKPGWFLYIEGEGNFQVLEPKPYDNGLIIHVRHCESSEESDFLIEQMDDFAKKSKVPPIFAPSLEVLNQKILEHNPDPISSPEVAIDKNLLEHARLIYEKVTTIDSLISEYRSMCLIKGEVFSFTKALEKSVEVVNESKKYKSGISRASYYRLKKLIKKAKGDQIRLSSFLHRSTYQRTRFSLPTLNFLDTIIMRFSARSKELRDKESLYEIALGYLIHNKGYWINPTECEEVPANLIEELLDPRIPIEAILENPEKKKLLVKITLPSRSKFFEYRKWFQTNPDQTAKEIIERYGKEFYESQILNFDIFAHKASLPLQYVFADHCYLDIFLVDDETRSKPYRVWLTLLIDAFSRCILGMALLEEAPCIESIQTAIMHSIWSKDQWIESLDIDLPKGQKWDCFGIPLNLSVDNAWAHHSISLENLCRRISQHNTYNSITLRFRPPYKGRYGGLIERYFGNIQLKIKKALLPGAIISHDPQGVRNAAKEACILFEDLQKEIVKLILEYIYHPHSELGGMRPIDKWREGLLSGFPLVPPRTEANEKMFWRSYAETRIIHSQGVSVFGMTYSSKKMGKIARVGSNGKNIEYGFSYDPNDISRIALFRGDDYICDLFAKQLRLPDDSYLHVSLAENKMSKKIAKSEKRSSKDWILYIDEAKKLKERRLAEQKALKNKTKHSKPDKPQSCSAGTNNPKLNPPLLSSAFFEPIPSSKMDEEMTSYLVCFSK